MKKNNLDSLPITKKVDDVVISKSELRYILPILYKMRKQLKSKYDVEQKIDELVRDYRKNTFRGSIV